MCLTWPTEHTAHPYLGNFSTKPNLNEPDRLNTLCSPSIPCQDKFRPHQQPGQQWEKRLTNQTPRLPRQSLRFRAGRRRRWKLTLWEKKRWNSPFLLFLNVVSLCSNLLLFVVCLLQTPPPLCKSTSPLKAKESWAVSPVNTQSPTWSTCSSWEFAYFLHIAKIRKKKKQKYPPFKRGWNTPTHLENTPTHLNNEVAEFLEVAVALPWIAVYMKLLQNFLSILINM